MLHTADQTTQLERPPVQLVRPGLFLDMDGVLAPLAPTPSDVGPLARRTAVLMQLNERLGRRVAILSGRTLVEIDWISGGAVGPASGIHGLERRRSDGAIERTDVPDTLGAVVAAFGDFARTRPGVLVEDKGASVGLHYRQAPDSGEDARALATRLAEETGLTLQPGHMVLEVKTPGADKGTALAAFMTEPPFIGSVPVMLGDDLTDEFAFDAATALGGFGILVGPERRTHARYRLEDVEDVLTWLETVVETDT